MSEDENSASNSEDGAEVRLLLDQGIDANSYLLDGEDTALLVAVEHGHIDNVQLLLDKGASVSIKDDGGRNLLGTAVAGDFLDILQLLLDRGARIDAFSDNGRTLLEVAVENDNADMVRILLDRGASIDLITDYDRIGLLMYKAVKHNNPDMVRCLLDSGVDIDILIKPVYRPGASIKGHLKRFPHQDARETALSAAVRYGLLDLMWLLLDRGAAMDKKLIDSAGNPQVREAIRVEEEWRRVRNFVQFLHMSGFSSQQWSVRYPDIVEDGGGGGDAVRARPVAPRQQGNVLHNRDLCRIISGYIPNVYYNEDGGGGSNVDHHNDDDDNNSDCVDENDEDEVEVEGN